MTPLCDLAKKHGTDKFWPHNYTPVYYGLFASRANRVRKVMEIGIGKGRSLRMWQEFFPNALISGIDIDPAKLIRDERIQSASANQVDAKAMTALANGWGGSFDLIIDDGSHREKNQIATMLIMLPFIAPDGAYVIEDIKADPEPIMRRIPKGFRHRVHVGEKMQPSGRCEQMLVVTQALS